jgi:hypothetical protein
MRTNNLYEISLNYACGLDTSMVQTNAAAAGFSTIREEMNRFLMNLTCSHGTAFRSEQVHYLYLALEHLVNVEEEISISDVDEEIIRLEKVLDKILSLKQLIHEYIRHLTSQD